MTTKGLRQAFFAGLAAALLSTTALTAVSAIAVRPALADDQDDQASVSAFFDYGYGVCDAEVLSKFWGVDFWRAKVLGGQKVQGGAQDVLSEMLSEAYRTHVCGQSSALEYRDAADVATLWMERSEA